MKDARAIALKLLQDVLQRGRPLDEALAANADLPLLEPRDRAFARLLTATVLRRLGQIDLAIDERLEHPLPANRTVIRDILRLGVAQISLLGLAAHAAVHTSVELVGGGGQAGMKGLVNAVLRRIAEGARIPADDPEHLNVPAWLWQEWENAYGAETATAIATANLAEAPLDITVKSPAETELWAEQLGAEILPNGSLRRMAGGDVTTLPGFAEGAWWIQDAAAALPARLLGDVSGQRVADLCAAPGGKTAQLAAAGALVTAVDISEKRLQRLSNNLERLELAAEAVTIDAAKWIPDELFDAALLDAPCSATGTLRRHPDIAWNKTSADVAKLAAVQDRLLAASLALVKPGGLLIYATCSLQPSEGVERVEALLASGAAVQRVPIESDELPDLAEAITPAGDLRTLPCHWPARGGMDGFYAARLRRLS
ncbi:MAG: MFS transporter [Alphaproteobacteria bacterium]|nr:MFS transporter [Alphaproteobacteria bacterium]